MPKGIRHLALALVIAGFAVGAPAADAPPVAVQERVLVMPRLPAGGAPPMNLPQDGALKMPFVSGGPPGAAARINASVWQEMLDGAAPPNTPGRTFTPPLDHLPQGMTELQYQAALIPTTHPRLLSLEFSGEGCGAYCEDYTTTLVFDLRDGRKLTLSDLLTPEGLATVGRRVDAERRRAYQQQLRELRAASKSAGRRTRSDDDDIADRIALNRECLASVQADPSTPERLADARFTLDARGGLVLSLHRCSNHAMRALDDVGALRVAWVAAELGPALSPYGRAVLQPGSDAAPSTGVDGRELHGTLGGMPITMVLEPLRDGGAETGGWYAYDKYRTPIALAVRRQGGGLSAIEQTESAGRFELTITGGALAGSWSDKDRRKRLPVALQ